MVTQPPEDELGDEIRALRETLVALRGSESVRTSAVCRAQATSSDIQITLEDQVITVSPTPESILELLRTAWLIGGFDLVAALHASMAALAASVPEIERRAQQLIDSASIAGMAPRLDDDLSGPLGHAANRQDGLDGTERLRMARVAREVKRGFEAAWRDLVLAEEDALASYEAYAIPEFQRLLMEARVVTLQEWSRYSPRLASDPGGLTVALEQVIKANTPASQLLLSATAKELRTALRQLHKAWAELINAEWQHRGLVGQRDGYLRTANPTTEPALQRQSSQESMDILRDKFSALHQSLSQQFPVVSVAYRHAARDNSDLQLDQLLIDTLIQSLRELDTLQPAISQMRLFGADIGRWSVFPEDKDAHIHADEGLHLRDGLAIPASRNVARHIAQRSAAYLPALTEPLVAMSLHERALAGDTALSAYATPGRLAHAAVTHLRDDLATLRADEHEGLIRVQFLIFGLGLVAAPFTKGGSMLLAGAINAALIAEQSRANLVDHKAQRERARAAITPILAQAWRHPSTADLIQQLTNSGFAIASELVQAGKAAVILDAIQVAIALHLGLAELNEWEKSAAPLGEQGG